MPSGSRHFTRNSSSRIEPRQGLVGLAVADFADLKGNGGGCRRQLHDADNCMPSHFIKRGQMVGRVSFLNL